MNMNIPQVTFPGQSIAFVCDTFELGVRSPELGYWTGLHPRAGHVEASAVGTVPRFKNAQHKSIRDLRAVESACPAITKNYIFPTTDKSSVQVRALVSACYGSLFNRGTLGDVM